MIPREYCQNSEPHETSPVESMGNSKQNAPSHNHCSTGEVAERLIKSPGAILDSAAQRGWPEGPRAGCPSQCTGLENQQGFVALRGFDKSAEADLDARSAPRRGE